MTHRKKRVLIVEDNAMDSSLLAKMLRHGYGEFDIVRAERLTDAVAQLTRDPFHAIISDLTLPEIGRAHV